MNKYIRNSYFLMLVLSLSTYGQNNNNSGLMLFSSSLGSNKLENSRLWYRDSTVICEMKAFFEYSMNDTVFFKGYETYKYTFFDLRTLKCQDYYSFSDTASARTNYFVEKGEAPDWNFYLGKSVRSLDSMVKLSDTIIENRVFKRWQYRENRPGYDYRFTETIYLVCDETYWDVFHVNKELEKINPGCYITKHDMRVEGAQKIRDSTSYEFVRKKLTAEENKIFDCWEKNAGKTKLPLKTLAEARKIRMIPLKYKDDPRFLMPGKVE